MLKQVRNTIQICSTTYLSVFRLKSQAGPHPKPALELGKSAFMISTAAGKLQDFTNSWCRNLANPFRPINSSTSQLAGQDVGRCRMATASNAVDRITKPVIQKPTTSQVMIRLSMLWTVPMALRAVVQLRVADILAAQAGDGGFLAPTEIAAHIPNSTAFTVPTIARLLRLLTAYGLFDEEIKEEVHGQEGGGGSVERRFALNELSRTLLEDQDGLSFRDLVFCLTDYYIQKGSQFLSETAIDGEEPFVKAFGTDVWSYMAQNPGLAIVFHRFMSAVSKLDVVKEYAGLKEIKGTLVDVGGGQGRAISNIVKAHPQIRGINFDQPHVIATAPSYPGVEHVAGDMFESVPKGDAVFLKWILHDWNDQACLKLLRNIHKALPSHGKLIIVEAVLPIETNQTEAAKAQLSVDILMLTVNVGGKERTEAEFRKLVTDAGFSKLEVVYTRDAHFSAIEVSV